MTDVVLRQAFLAAARGLTLGDSASVTWTFDPATNKITATASGGGGGGPFTSADITDFVEAAQDAVGTVLTDSSSIDFTYNDGAGTMTAVVLPAGVDHDALANFVANEHIDHTAVTISAGTGLTGGGDISANRSIALSHLGIQSLTDPGADSLMFWDDSAGAVTWLSLGTGATITGTTFDVTPLDVTLDYTMTGRWVFEAPTTTPSWGQVRFMIPGGSGVEAGIAIGANAGSQFLHNTYFDGTDWRRRAIGFAAGLFMHEGNDRYEFRYGGSSSAGSVISWVYPLILNNTTATWTIRHEGIDGTEANPVYSYTASNAAGHWFDSSNSIINTSVGGTNRFQVGTSFVRAPNVTGTATTPQYSFISDTNTGMFRSAADNLAFTTGGTSRLAIDSSGRVTIGSSLTAPAAVTSADPTALMLANLSQSLAMVTAGTSVTAGVRFIGAGGTIASPSAVSVANTPILGFIGAAGYDGTTWQTGSAATVALRPGGTWSGTSRPAYITLETTPVSSTTRVERVRVPEDGGIAVQDGISTPATIAGMAIIFVDSADGDLKVKFGDGTVRLIVAD